MSEPTVYELLAKQIDGGFERLDARMNQLLEQQRITNGRVNDAHIRLASHDAQLTASAERISLVASAHADTATKLNAITQTMNSFISGGAARSFRQVLARDVTLVISSVSICVVLLKFLKVIP
jgi:hypothetical protein